MKPAINAAFHLGGSALTSRRKKKITIRDLARELNLSPRAVSQALHPRESTVKLSPETVKRVQQLALKCNFRPDSRARSMRGGRFFNIGYFEAMKHTDSWPVLGAESGVYDYASEHGNRVCLIRLPPGLENERRAIPSAFNEAHVDALIISHAGNLSHELEKVIDESGFPVVYLNEKRATNAVYVDDRRSAAELTQHIIGQGKREIAYLHTTDYSDDCHYSAPDRQSGYHDAMTLAGLQPVDVYACKVDPEWERKLTLWIQTHPELEALIAYSDYSALSTFRAIRNLPIKVPQDLLLAGFGDDFGKECSPVPLTTMRIPFYEMGRAAARMALDLVESGQEIAPSRLFQTSLVVRESTSVISSQA